MVRCYIVGINSQKASFSLPTLVVITYSTQITLLYNSFIAKSKIFIKVILCNIQIYYYYYF